MSDFKYTSNSPINININVHQNLMIAVEGSTPVDESLYDYILDVDLAKTFITNGNWVTNPDLLATMLITPQITILSHGIRINNAGNIFIVSRDNGTIMKSTDKGNTYKNFTVCPNGNRLSRPAISNGYYPAYILIATYNTLYTSTNGGNTWQGTTLPNGGFPTNAILHTHVCNNGRFQAISYSFLSATVTNTSLMSKYFIISINYGLTWTRVNLDYRQLLLTWSTLRLYYLTYGSSPTLYSCGLEGIVLNNITWSSVYQFQTPQTGYCPILTISGNGKYISLLYQDTTTVQYLSNDSGQTWTNKSISYLINNQYNLDITSISISGKIHTFWINDANGLNYLAYSINYGVTWNCVAIYNTIQSNTYGIYDIMDNGSHILLYQPNLASVIYIQLTLVMNDLFDTFTYIQDQNNSELVSVNIVPDINTFSNVFGLYTAIYSSLPTILQRSNSYGLLNKGNGSVGNKMLEVIATKIFGNPRAVAAIVNDTDYINMAGKGSAVSNSIITGITTTLYEKKDSIFNQYVGSYIYQTDGYGLAAGYGDAVVPLTFNLTDTAISVPLNLIGGLYVPNSTAIQMASALTLLRNGVNAGGTQVLNGQYNVPFLLKFHFN